MSMEHVARTIQMVQDQIAELDREILGKKRMVNDLAALDGLPPIYGEAALSESSAAQTTRPDEYYGQPLATVVRLILEKRQATQRGAATVNEIYDEMVAGGYAFNAKNDENAKRGLYISLGKNSSTFHKLPNGTYGLLEWYPDAKSSKTNGSNGKAADPKPLHEELQESEDDQDDRAEASPTKAR